MKTSMEEAFTLWWYMSWRTALLVLPINFISGILMNILIPDTSISGWRISTWTMILYKILEYWSIIIWIIASVYFLSLWITKFYKKSNW